MTNGRTGATRDDRVRADERERERLAISRRALVAVSGVGLTAGCLRLEGQEAGNESESNEGSSDGESGGGDPSSSEDDDSDGLQVISAVGFAGESSNNIVTVNMTVRRMPGSGNIDLSTIGIEMIVDNAVPDNDYQASFVHASRDGTPVYFVEPIQTDDRTNAVLTSDNDRYSITIPLGSIPGDRDPAASDPVASGRNVENSELEALGEGASAEIITAGIGLSETFLTVPESLDSSQTVRL